uniref:Uncharacterized protein n=1 Tax=Arundo donax TaxID=35708 RepID=A0A0A9D0E2_ARUDO
MQQASSLARWIYHSKVSATCFLYRLQQR